MGRPVRGDRDTGDREAVCRDCDIKPPKTGPTRLSAEEERKENRTDHIKQGEPRALRPRKTRETLVDCNTDSEDEHTDLRDPSPNRTEVQQGKLCVSSDP